MSKHTMIKRRKRQDALWRKYAFYPQRAITTVWNGHIPDPQTDRLITLPPDPYRRTSDR